MAERGPKWHLTGPALERLLKLFHSDPDRAAEAYELLRARLVRFFEFRGLIDTGDAADRTLDRVARHLEQGEDIREPASYALAIARNIALEVGRERGRETPLEIDVAAPPSTAAEGSRQRCFDHCLATLRTADRELILTYYRDERRAKIDHRRVLAEKLGIGVNALRIRTHRIRAQLDRCLQDCLAREEDLK